MVPYWLKSIRPHPGGLEVSQGKKIPREKTGPGTRTRIDILVITAAVKIAQGKNQVLKITGNSKNSYVIPLPKKINSWKSIFSKCTVDDCL